MIKQFMKKYWPDILVALGITVLFCLPYITKDFVGIEHDTYFHFSRITGLAERIQDFDLLPAIYPYKNNGYGYASPMFYNDLLLYLPAILYNLGFSLAFCYKAVIFGSTFCSASAMMYLTKRITKNRYISYIVSFAYIFSNYRITDTFVRSAVGEVMAFTFLPLLLLGLYEVFECRNTKKRYLVTLGLAGLILCHNLTFFLGVIITILFYLVYMTKMDKTLHIAFFKSVFLAFLLTAWFTLPMLEQLQSNTFILNYYGSTTDLAGSSLPLWKYFANTTVFGYASHDLSREQSMLINVGWTLMFTPLLYFFVPKEKKNRFVTLSMIIGYTAMLLPLDIIPWQYISFLRILQFPWRLLTIALPMLCIPASVGMKELFVTKKKIIVSFALIVFLTAEGIYHLFPVYSRTFGITSETTYQDILDGKYSDPYYSASYMRVELAGGDYLPLNSPDFRTLTTNIKDANMNDLDLAYTKDGTSLTFKLTEENQTIILPVTWYKGYQVYYVDGNTKVKVDTFASANSLVEFTGTQSGIYTLEYHNTLLRNVSILTSLITVIYLIYRQFIKLNK